MARLMLSLLGPLKIELDGEPVSGLATAKVRALLVYLAVEADRPQPSGPLPQQQVRHERDRHQRGADAEDLPGQIQPWPTGGGRGVEVRRLVLQPARLRHRADKADQRGHRARTDRDGLLPLVSQRDLHRGFRRLVYGRGRNAPSHEQTTCQ